MRRRGNEERPREAVRGQRSQSCRYVRPLGAVHVGPVDVGVGGVHVLQMLHERAVDTAPVDTYVTIDILDTSTCAKHTSACPTYQCRSYRCFIIQRPPLLAPPLPSSLLPPRSLAEDGLLAGSLRRRLVCVQVVNNGAE